MEYVWIVTSEDRYGDALSFGIEEVFSDESMAKEFIQTEGAKYKTLKFRLEKYHVTSPRPVINF